MKLLVGNDSRINANLANVVKGKITSCIFEFVDFRSKRITIINNIVIKNFNSVNA